MMQKFYNKVEKGLNRMYMQKGCTDPSKIFIAKLKDSSLLSHLDATFQLLEMRYGNLDHDKAGTITYRELQNELSMVGFTDGDQLERVFAKVDEDKNGTLDFAEFLMLVFIFTMENGNVECFFSYEENRVIAEKTIKMMWSCYTKYDADRSLELSMSEIQAFFKAEIPAAVNLGVLASCLAEGHHDPDGSGKTSFSEFMRLLYVVVSRMPDAGPKGKYCGAKENTADRFKQGTGESSQFWKQLNEGLSIMEEDFKIIDVDRSGTIDIKELTSTVPADVPNYIRYDMYSRLEAAFKVVDIDGSRNLDFFEFLYLGFQMSMNGPYSDLIRNSRNSSLVKKCFMDIHTYYRRFDADKNNRLDKQELQTFVSSLFGSVPSSFEANWSACAYVSKTAGREVVDIVKLMKFFYLTIRPSGCFNPNKGYKPAHVPIEFDVVTVPVVKADPHPPRINPVIPSRFQKIKLLGQGGQGTVHLGKYDGQKVAGKTFLAAADANLVKECQDEIVFFNAIDHPNCHYLLGAKTTLDNGGILMLTEVCDNGSFFDLYAKHQKRFDTATQWRIAKECAMGIEAIHKIGYMHRDIKSLNVFMDKNMSAKVADFGMCTKEPYRADGAGTVQWMAPEVVKNLFRQQYPPSQYDKRCDIYSAAVLIWEVFHLSCPYSETRLDQMSIGRAVLGQGIRPRMSSRCPPPVSALIQAMWSADANRRPSMSAVVAEFDKPEFKAACRVH